MVTHYDPKSISTVETKFGKVLGSYPHLKEVKFLEYYGSKAAGVFAGFFEVGAQSQQQC